MPYTIGMKGADVKAFRESLPKPHDTAEGFAKIIGRTRQSVWEYETSENAPRHVKALLTFATFARDRATHAELVGLLAKIRNGS